MKSKSNVSGISQRRLTPWADPECGLAHGVDQAALGMCPTCNASAINGSEISELQGFQDVPGRICKNHQKPSN